MADMISRRELMAGAAATAGYCGLDPLWTFWMLVVRGGQINFHLGFASILFVVAGVWLSLRWMSRARACRCPVCGQLFQFPELKFRWGRGQ